MEKVEKDLNVDGKNQELDKEAKERKKVHRSLAEMLGGVNIGIEKRRKMKLLVVIHPRVGKLLRPNQVEGVEFLYKCVTGMIDEKAFG